MSNFSYFVTSYLQVVAVRPFFMHALSCTLTLTHTREITIAMCISCVSGCSCCSFVATITRISTTFFQKFWTCISKYVRVCVYSTRNQMVVIYTCLYVPLYHYSMIIIIFAKSLKSTLFNTHSDSINCRTNDLWPFFMRCSIQPVLAKANSCQFFFASLVSHFISLSIATKII